MLSGRILLNITETKARDFIFNTTANHVKLTLHKVKSPNSGNIVKIQKSDSNSSLE